MQGYVNLRPEDDEDMWHLYNIIQEVRRSHSLGIRTVRYLRVCLLQGDEVRAAAIRSERPKLFGLPN